MKILIKVTKEILEKSVNCVGVHSQNCAVALAVREFWPHAGVGRHEIHVVSLYGPNAPKETPMIPLPPSATKFIRLFDSLPKPLRVLLPEFSFEINVPQEVIEKIGINEVYKILSESKTLELVQP